MSDGRRGQAGSGRVWASLSAPRWASRAGGETNSPSGALRASVHRAPAPAGPQTTPHRRTTRWLTVATMALVVGLSSSASAHQSLHPKFLTLRLGCAKSQVVVWYALQPGAESQEARARADRDRDGLVTDDEQDHLRDLLLELATATLELALDGADLLPPPPRSVVLTNGAEPTASGAELGVTFTLDLPTPWSDGAPHVLRVRDHHKDPQFTVPLRILPDPRLAWGSPVPGLETLTGEGVPLSSGTEVLLYVAPGECAH